METELFHRLVHILMLPSLSLAPDRQIKSPLRHADVVCALSHRWGRQDQQELLVWRQEPLRDVTTVSAVSMLYIMIDNTCTGVVKEPLRYTNSIWNTWSHAGTDRQTDEGIDVRTLTFLNVPSTLSCDWCVIRTRKHCKCTHVSQ